MSRQANTGASDRIVDRYLDRRDQGVRREVVTPEGVPVGFTLARAGDRIGGFLVDMLIIYGVIIVLALLLAFAFGSSLSRANWTVPFILVFVFLLQNFYFVFFELKWQGMTPGKRVVGIRVIDGHGGVLGAHAVIARNLVRDIEVFIPLQLILAPEQLWPGAPGWARALSSAWALVFMFLPLFNRDRLRIGDMVAGTLVVLAPRAVLLPDIGGQETADSAAGENEYQFTEQQLSIYGIYELQVLEDLLRQDEDSLAHMKAMVTVSEQIRRKIGWARLRTAPVDDERFLRAFYAAMRAHLERKMLFGKRREDKYSGE
ncbi:MAG: RDD family protein [Proteobacteria bacterium]|nr:RDD family protein [Pseudomonadota bacterium]